MKVKTIERFTDLKENKIREVGEVFEVTKARLDELLSLPNVVELMPETPKQKKGD